MLLHTCGICKARLQCCNASKSSHTKTTAPAAPRRRSISAKVEGCCGGPAVHVSSTVFSFLFCKVEKHLQPLQHSISSGMCLTGCPQPTLIIQESKTQAQPHSAKDGVNLNPLPKASLATPKAGVTTGNDNDGAAISAMVLSATHVVTDGPEPNSPPHLAPTSQRAQAVFLPRRLRSILFAHAFTFGFALHACCCSLCS